MKPIIDLNKEYGLVFDGGGARGAYQIGAWRALSEAGVKISAVAGTSVGALNGALVCMGDLEKAGHIWKEMAFSRVMDVDDELMEQFFDGEASIREILKGLWKKLADGGIDITPLKELIHEVVDEEKIRKCGKEFCLLTFSVSDMKELDLSIEDIPEGLLEDFLLASAYLLGFKNEPLHGKTYIDGGAVNNVPTASLLKRGYKDLIQVRIFGPGRVPKTTIPEDGSLLEIEPRVGLGSILEFSAKRSRQNLKIGYYDAKRALYGLTGSIYYIEETREECYYVEIMKLLSELEKTEYRFKLKLPIGCSDRELFYGMLEASAKLMRIPKYNIYTADELWNETSRKYGTLTDEGKEKLPKFVHAIAKLRKDYKMNLKGRSFLKLEDYEKSRQHFEAACAGTKKTDKESRIAAGMAAVSACLAEKTLPEEELKQALEQTALLLEEKEDAIYYRCVLKGYTRLDAKEQREELLRLGIQYRALGEKEGQEEVTQWMAMAYEQNGKKSDAAKMYEELLAVEGKRAEREELYRKVTELFLADKKNDDAMRRIREGVTEYPDSVELQVLKLRVTCKEKEKNRRACRKALERAVKNRTDIQKNEDFRKLLQEQGFQMKGEKVCEKE